MFPCSTLFWWDLIVLFIDRCSVMFVRPSESVELFYQIMLTNADTSMRSIQVVCFIVSRILILQMMLATVETSTLPRSSGDDHCQGRCLVQVARSNTMIPGD